MYTLRISEKSKLSNKLVNGDIYEEFLLHINIAHEFFHLIVSINDSKKRFNLTPLQEEYYASLFAIEVMTRCSNKLLIKYLRLFEKKIYETDHTIESYEEYISRNNLKILTDSDEYSNFQIFTYIRWKKIVKINIFAFLEDNGVSINTNTFNEIEKNVIEITRKFKMGYKFASNLLLVLKQIFLKDNQHFKFCIVNKPNHDDVSCSTILESDIVFSEII